MYPHTPCAPSYVNSKYTSFIIDFVPLENEDRDGKPLQEPTAAQQQLLQTFKVTGYPFLDIGNRYQVGALYDPGVLRKSGVTLEETRNRIKQLLVKGQSTGASEPEQHGESL